jgi:hypothetical protein
MRPLTLYLMGALYRTSRKSGPGRSREDGLTPADIPSTKPVAGIQRWLPRNTN